MHVQHPVPVIEQSIILNEVSGLSLGNPVHAGATSSSRPTEAFNVAVSHGNSVLQA
jgi:hypothetical protein